MEKLEEQKDKHGSIIFNVVLLNAVFTVFVLAGMAVYMLTRITQQEHEIANLKTMLYQLHPHIKIKAGMTAEGTNKRQGFQKTEFAEQDENEGEMPKAKAEISNAQRQRTARSTCHCGSSAGEIVMLNESAHVVGEGGPKEPVVRMGTKYYLLTAWKRKHASGHMSYSKGFLTVGVEGYYYIYGQINYVDGRSAMTGYIIYIDETPVIKAVNSVISKMRKYDTSYIGGVFYIRSGQRISVRTPFQQKMFYDATRAYFGAFMVHR